MKCFIFIIACFTILVFVSFSLCAQEKEVTLEPVVVTATRDVQEIRKVPANVTVITKEEIAERSHTQTTLDLLRDEVGVVVQDLTGTGKNASVDIRGFGETGPLNTLVLVDGRRVNQIDLSGVDWSQIPLDQIERIEVVRGSGSVLYGDNAVGGVINIITKRPEKTFSAKAEVIGGSYNLSKESGSVGGKWGSLSAILNGGYSSTEGYRQNGFLRARDVGGKVIYDLNDILSFNFSGGFHRDDTGLPGYLPSEKNHTRGSQNPDDQAQTDDGYGALTVKAKLKDFGRIEADLSYRHREVDTSFVSSGITLGGNLKTWGFTPRYILEKPLLDHSNKLTFGLDFYKSDSDVDSDSAFFGSDRLEVTKRSTGLYLLDEFSILKNLILSVGYRHEWVTFDLFEQASNSRDRSRDGEPAWNVGLDYLFSKRSSAFFSLKRSFRFPVSDELIQYISSPIPPFKIERIQVNPDLKPQTGYHYEAGIRHALNDQIEANLTLFWIDLHDEIFLNPETFANENISRTRRQGVEIGTRAKPFPWLLLWANYGYIRPLIREGQFSGSDIPWVPRHKGSIGADIQLGRGFVFDARANVISSRHFISDFDNQFDRVKGYYTLDTKVSYAWKGLRAFVGVNNLFNRRYSEFAVIRINPFDNSVIRSFYPSPERNFVGGISYSF